MTFKKTIEKNSDNFYTIFRIGIGLLFLMTGLKKIFGIWGMPSPASFATMMWFAGVFELMIGSALIFGVLVRLASFFGVIMMSVAFYIGHVSKGGWNPAVNNGMSALLFAFAFLTILAYGAKKLSLEKTFFGKEIF